MLAIKVKRFDRTVIYFDIFDVMHYERCTGDLVNISSIFTGNENMKSAPKNKRNKRERKNDKTVTTAVGDCKVRAVYRWELSDKNERVVVMRFSRSTTENMKISNLHSKMIPIVSLFM